MEYDVSDGLVCSVAQKDGSNYSKQAFFRSVLKHCIAAFFLQGMDVKNFYGGL